MISIAAIKKGLSQGFRFSGRMSRADFWGFAPVWTGIALLCLVGGGWAFPQAGASVPVLLAVSLVSIPLWAAACRRFHDIGQSSFAALYPFVPVTLALASLYLVIVGDPAMPRGSYHPAALVLLGCAAMLAPSFLGYAFNARRLGEHIGAFLVSSDPRTNRFGPNPNEVRS